MVETKRRKFFKVLNASNSGIAVVRIEYWRRRTTLGRALWRRGVRIRKGGLFGLVKKADLNGNDLQGRRHDPREFLQDILGLQRGIA